MNKVFSNCFRAIKTKPVTSFKEVISCVPGSSLLGSINKYRDYLSTNSGVADSFIGALTQTQDLMSDIAMDSDMRFTSTINDFSNVSTDVADDLIDGFGDVCHCGKSEITKLGATLTDDAQGVYNLIDQRSQNVIIDGYQVLFSCTDSVSRVSEAVIAKNVDTNEYLINNFIRTADFVKDQGERVKPDTIQGKLHSICLIKGRPIQDDSILALVGNILGGTATEISEIFVDLINHDLPVTYELNTDIDALWDYYNHTYPLERGAGKINSIWNVVSSQIQSSTLNQFILKACEAVTTGIQNAALVTSIVTEAMESKFKAIKTFGSGIARAFNYGGVYGVASYIISYIKDLISMKDREDGVFDFQDNARLAPKIYLSGIINAIITVISEVVSFVVMIFSRIAGAVLAVIGALASSIYKAVTYNYDVEGNAALNTNDDVFIPMAPYGIIQSEISVNSISPDIKELLDQGENFMYAIIPGGYVLIGPGSFTDKGIVNTIRLELHPSIADNHLFFQKMCLDMIMNGYARTSYTYDQSTQSYKGHMYLTVTGEEALSALDDWFFGDDNDYNRMSQDLALLNEDNGVLSNDNDKLLRQLTMENTFISLVFLALITDGSILNDDHLNGYIANGTVLGQDDPIWIHYVSQLNDCPSWYAFFCYGPNDRKITYMDGTQSLLQLREPLSSSVYFSEWLDITSYMYDPLESLVGVNLISIFTNLYSMQTYYNDIITMKKLSAAALYLPKYDKKTYWAIIIGSAIVTAVIASVAIVATIKIRKKIQQKRAINQAAVEKAHDDLKANPTAENYEKYRKITKKNNMWANLVGGTKYDYVNYWNGDPTESQSAGSTEGSVKNLVGLYSAVVDDPSKFSLSQQDEDANAIYSNGELSEIRRLICGQS